MLVNLNNLCPEYFKVKGEFKTEITIAIKENSRIEIDYIVETGLVDHHTEEKHNLDRD